MRRNNTIIYVAVGGLTASFYMVLTFISAVLGLSSGFIQFRISEALCILPMYSVAAILGLTIGCLLSNLLVGGFIWDVVFGSLATFLGAVGTYMLRKHRWIAPICPVIANATIIPLILVHVYGIQQAYWVIVVSITISEFLCAYVFGQFFIEIIRRNKIIPSEH